MILMIEARSISSVISGSILAKPTMAFSGVRISWLMLARKAVFNWSDCSAFTLASSNSVSITLRSVISHEIPISSGSLRSSTGTSIFTVLTIRFWPVTTEYSSSKGGNSPRFNNSRSSRWK